MKYLLSLLLLPMCLSLSGQVDTNAARHLYYHVMKFTEASTDSIAWYAGYFDRLYSSNEYPAARFMALRLHGYYYENKGNFARAIDYYLQALDVARRQGYIEHQTEVLSDLAAVYTSDMKEPGKAKIIYQECVRLNKELGDAHSLLNSYINLGAIYNRLGLYDSALIFLQEGLKVGKPMEERDEDD